MSWVVRSLRICKYKISIYFIFHCFYLKPMYYIYCGEINPVKSVVNCQNTRDNVVPRMQQWPLDIPQWHITPHPQLSAKIIILYAFHTHRGIKSKFPSLISSIYLSDIYEEIIHRFSHVGFVFRHKRLCYFGGLETVDLKHIDSKNFPSQHGTLTKFCFNVGQRCRRWSTIQTALGQFFFGVVSCNQFSLWYYCCQSVLYMLM